MNTTEKRQELPTHSSHLSTLVSKEIPMFEPIISIRVDGMKRRPENTTMPPTIDARATKPRFYLTFDILVWG